MWIAIKDNYADLAWRCFCDAEDYARMSARWLPDFMPAQEQPQRLRDIERVCFPRQPFFLSTATIVAEDDMSARCAIKCMPNASTSSEFSIAAG